MFINFLEKYLLYSAFSFSLILRKCYEDLILRKDSRAFYAIRKAVD